MYICYSKKSKKTKKRNTESINVCSTVILHMEVFEREAKRKYIIDKEKYKSFQVSLNSYNHLMFR